MSDLSPGLQQAIDMVKARSREDRVFRALALSNSSEALRLSGHSLKDPAVVFTERSGPVPVNKGEIVVELPAIEVDAVEELSDADLEQVSGGGDGSGSGVTWN